MSSHASPFGEGAVDRAAFMRERVSMYSNNKLKLGLFGANCSSGRSVTTVPERWSGSWKDCLALAQTAEEAGIEFMLPIGRWKGYGGETDYQGTTLETVTWAAGLLAKTKKITVFGTVHAPMIHPVIAAKEFVTADHIGEGRFGLNIVVGWNEDEFEMFGLEQRDHERRYDYATEWLQAMKMMWSREDEFDFDGEFLKLKYLRAKPKPYNGTRPFIMNAAVSDTGRAFAIANCDGLFCSATYGKFEVAAEQVRDVKAKARAAGRDIDLFTTGVITCRPTAKEAEEYHRHCIIDNADWGAVDHILSMRKITPETHPDYIALRKHAANGMGGLTLIGDPDKIANDLALLSQTGFAGVAISLMNYGTDFPYFRQEVLPRLAKMGLREEVKS